MLKDGLPLPGGGSGIPVKPNCAIVCIASVALLLEEFVLLKPARTSFTNRAVMTHEKIHSVIVAIAETLQYHHDAISDGHPTDEEGFVKPADPDLRDALRAIDNATWVLSKLAFNMMK